uniref:Muscle-restricted coiled-coil protein n=1 Tax=Hucho hucho TaxID=62062 RepID=A0A4W5R8G6_9TELE
MDQSKYCLARVQDKREVLGLLDDVSNPVSALTILSLLDRVAGIIDNVQSGQQRMEEQQLELETNSNVLKLANDHTTTSGTVEKLLQKTLKVSSNVKVRTCVEKQNVCVKKVENTQEELLTRNKFRVVIYQDNIFIPENVFIPEETVQEAGGTCKSMLFLRLLFISSICSENNYSLIDAFIVFYQQERRVSTACQTDPLVPECSCAAVEKRSTGTITKELWGQQDCAHDPQYTTESCPYTPQMELTESEISEDHNSLYEPESSESQSSQCEPRYTITLGERDGVPKM